MSQASYKPASGEALAIIETGGPTTLPIGAVADGQFLKRVGATIVGAAGGGGVVDVEPPARTIMVSDPVPTGADPALTFASLQAGLDAAVAVYSPTSTARALVLVAYKATAYGNAVMPPNVDLKCIAMDDVWRRPEPGANSPDAPLQEIGNLSFAPVGAVDEFVRVEGFQVNGTLAVDFSGKGGGAGKFFGNGRVIGATAVTGGASDVFGWQGTLSTASSVTIIGTAATFNVLIPGVTVGTTTVSAAVLMDFERGVAVAAMTLLGSATLSGPTLWADNANLSAGLTTTGVDAAAVITVHANGARMAATFSSDDLGIHTVDAPNLEIFGNITAREGADVNIANSSQDGGGASVDVYGNGGVYMRGTKIKGTISLNVGATGAIECSDCSCGSVAQLSAAGTIFAENVTANTIANSDTGTLIAPGCVVGATLPGLISNDAGTLDVSNCSLTGNMSNGGVGTINAAGATVSGNMTNVSAGTINAANATVGGNVLNSSTGIINAQGATCVGDVTCDAAGTLRIDGSPNIGGDVLVNGGSTVGIKHAVIAGAIYMDGADTIHADGVVVTGNIEVAGAGTIHAKSATVGGSIVNNSTGGIVNAYGATVVGDLSVNGACTINANGATVSGIALNDGTGGTLNLIGGSLGGGLTHDGGTTNATDATIAGALIKSGVGVLTFNGGTAASMVVSSGSGAVSMRNATVIGALTASSSAVIDFRGGTAASIGGAGSGTIRFQGGRLDTADNVPGGTNVVLRDQTGVSQAFSAADPDIVVTFSGPAYSAGTDYRVLLTQTVGAPVAARVDTKTATTFTITVPVGVDEVFAYELVAV